MSNSLPLELKSTLNDIIKMVNVVKSRPLQSRLFSILWDEMGSEHQSLLFRTEVRWLSRGRVVSRVHELKEELKVFFRVTLSIQLSWKTITGCKKWPS
jgi:hypothetical protein